MLRWAGGCIASLVASVALLRRLRVDRHFSAALVVTVWLSALSLAAIPRLLNQMSDAELEQALQEAQRTQPAISVTLQQRLPAGNAPLATLDERGARYQAALATPLRSIVSGRQTVVESPRFAVTGLDGGTQAACARQLGVANSCLLNLRAQPSDGLRVTAGHLPQVRPPLPASEIPALKADQPLPLVEVALSAKTAAALGLALGERIVIQPDSQDPLTLSVPIDLLNYRIVVELVGLIEPVDPSAPIWRGDPALLEPAINQDPDHRIVSAAALIAPDAYPQLLGLTAPVDWRYTWRYAVDPARVTGADVSVLAGALHALQVSHGPARLLDPDPSRVSLQTSLPDALDGYQQRRALVIGSLSLATVSILAIALALVAVLAALFAERRRAQLALVRSRGATRAQLGAAQLSEGLLLAIPAALVGYGSAAVLVHARASSLSLAAALGLALATPIVLLLGSLPSTRLPLGALLGRHIETPESTGVRRLVLEGLLVLLAGLGIVLLRRHGLTQPGGNFDPYLALVPILAGVAVGVVTLRLAPLPIRALAHLARGRRDLVPFVALRWVATQALVAWLPVLVLLLAVGITTLMTVLHHSLDTAQHAAAWQQVGADFRVDAGPGGALPTTLDFARMMGVESAAQASLIPGAPVALQSSTSRVSLLAIDSGADAAVAAGTLADPHFPAAMLGHGPTNELGSQANPIPVIVSTDWPTTPTPRRGDLLQPSLGSGSVVLQVIAVRRSFPGMPDGEPFIVAPLQQFQASGLAGELQPNRWLLRGPASLKASLQTALGAAPNAQLTARSAVDVTISQEPFLGGVTRLYWLSAGLVMIFALAAILSGLLHTTAERVRDLSYLRTLGLSTRQLLGLTVIEQALPVALATLIGAGLGLALAQGIAPAIDLSSFAGTDRAVALLIDWPQLAGVVAGLAALTLVLVVLFSLLLRRVNPAMILRGGNA